MISKLMWLLLLFYCSISLDNSINNKFFVWFWWFLQFCGVFKEVNLELGAEISKFSLSVLLSLLQQWLLLLILLRGVMMCFWVLGEKTPAITSLPISMTPCAGRGSTLSWMMTILEEVKPYLQLFLKRLRGQRILLLFCRKIMHLLGGAWRSWWR